MEERGWRKGRGVRGMDEGERSKGGTEEGVNGGRENGGRGDK